MVFGLSVKFLAKMHQTRNQRVGFNRVPDPEVMQLPFWPMRCTANLRTKIVDFRGFDSNIILMLRPGIVISIENFPESLSQQILVGIILVGRWGVVHMINHKGREFTKGGLVKGGLAIYALLLYHYC